MHVPGFYFSGRPTMSKRPHRKPRHRHNTTPKYPRVRLNDPPPVPAAARNDPRQLLLSGELPWPPAVPKLTR